MKLVFIAYLHGYGGAEKQIILLANEMKKREHDVTIISLAENNNCFEIENGINMIFVKEFSRGILAKANRYFGLKKVLKELKPDATINFWFQSAVFTAYTSSKYTGIKIYSERGDPNDKEYNGINSILRKKSFKHLDGFVFQTEKVKKCFSPEIQKKSIVIHNPVLIREKDYILPDVRNNTIITVGRLHEQKNQIYLINVFSKFLKTHKNYNLEIYGDGELKDYLKNKCKELGIEKNVKFMGNQKNIFEEIANSKMFILTSKYEGMPNALLEAMALGIPSISSNYEPKDSIYEFIDNGVNGFVYENEEELLKIMNKICDNDELLKNIGIQSKKISISNSKEIIYNKWEKYIIMCLNKGETNEK